MNVLSGARFGVSSRANTMLIANLVNESGGNVEDIKLSQS